MIKTFELTSKDLEAVEYAISVSNKTEVKASTPLQVIAEEIESVNPIWEPEADVAELIARFVHGQSLIDDDDVQLVTTVPTQNGYWLTMMEVPEYAISDRRIDELPGDYTTYSIDPAYPEEGMQEIEVGTRYVAKFLRRRQPGDTRTEVTISVEEMQPPRVGGED